MNEQWRDFLRNMGAEFDDTRITHFGNPENESRLVRNGLVMTDLSHYSLVKASGADQKTFLQGQLTNDIEKVTELHSQLSGYCDQKGRLLASFRIFQRGEQLYLKLPRDLYEDTFKRLRMFVLRSDVTFEPSDDLTGMGFSGPEADLELAKHIPDLPAETDQATQSGDFTVIRIAGKQPRYEIYSSPEKLIPLWEKLDVTATGVGPGAWELLDIEAGLPVIKPQTVDSFVPQMINLELVNGVSFQKGCYTGQEIVARMHYLGTLKRRMYRVHISTSQPVEAGTALYSPDSSSGQGTGNIVIAQPVDGGTEALAVIQISQVENSDLRLGDESGPEVTLLEQPYEFPPQKEPARKKL